MVATSNTTRLTTALTSMTVEFGSSGPGTGICLDRHRGFPLEGIGLTTPPNPSGPQRAELHPDNADPDIAFANSTMPGGEIEALLA